MKNYTDDKFGFIFMYPDSWHCDKENNIISVYDPENGLGALQFSVFYVGNQNEFDLKAELEDFLQDHKSIEIEMKDDLAYSKFTEGNRIWQYWLFQRGSSMILASYSCEIIYRGKEDNEIDGILNSFAQYSIN